jgi:acyl-coenzyme A thioesterase PaaI-like protein
VVGAIADHTMGAAAQTLAPEGRWVLTAEFKVSLLRAARGVLLECVGTVVKSGRALSFTEAEVFAVDAQGQRTLVAKASATMAVTRA